MADQIDFVLDQGATFTKTWTVYTDPTLSVPADLVGFTGLMEARTTYDSPIIVYTASTANGNMMIDPLQAMVQVNVAATDLDRLIFQTGENLDSVDLVYDVKITDGSNKSYRISQGTMTVNRAVTR
jgi:hypothetical protein